MRKYYYSIFLFNVILIFTSCNKIYYEDVDFISVYDISQKQNKKLWVMLGGGDNCRSCNDIINDLREKGIFKKYSKDYIFYKCNVMDTANIFLHYILLTEQIPNSYIFNEKGKLVFASYNNETTNRIEESLKFCLDGGKFHCAQKQLNISDSEELLRLHNYTLSAYFDENCHSALQFIDSSININPYFYNLYLKSKLLNKMGANEKSIEMKEMSMSYYKQGFQALLYKDLYEPINSKYNKKKFNEEFPEIKLERDIYNIKEHINANNEYKIKVKFQNAGNKPLFIYSVKSDCGCILTKYPKKPIMPNEKSEIELTYKDNNKGKFRRTIGIMTNSKKKYSTLLIVGEVK